MTPKKTILIVEDQLDTFKTVIDFLVKKTFPQEHFDVAFAGDLTSAAMILCDPTRSICAVVIDNGFPLAAGGERVGATRKPIAIDAGIDDDSILRQKEGGAGAMLLRFMRTGNTGAESQYSIVDLQALDDRLKDKLGDGYDTRMAELKQVLAVWNSADPRQGKVEGIKAIVNGQEINPENPLFLNEKVEIPQNGIVWVNENTGCAGKTFKQIFEAISQKLAQQKQNEPAEFSLCVQHGKEPKPETEFSLAVQHRRQDILQQILDGHGQEISAERISSAIGILCHSPNSQILDKIMQFPRFDPNAYSVVPMTNPEMVARPLYEAIGLGADAIVAKLLTLPNIFVTKDIKDLATQSDSTKIQGALNNYTGQIVEGSSFIKREELPDPSQIRGFGMEVRAVDPKIEPQK